MSEEQMLSDTDLFDPETDQRVTQLLSEVDDFIKQHKK